MILPRLKSTREQECFKTKLSLPSVKIEDEKGTTVNFSKLKLTMEHKHFISKISLTSEKVDEEKAKTIDFSRLKIHKGAQALHIQDSSFKYNNQR